jgi:serine/threonine protein kinase/Flp pilus assembly protein TadD
MSVPRSRLSQASSSDAVLVELFEEIATQLQAGNAVDLEAYVQEHPEQAEELRRLLPTIHVLAELGRSAAKGDPSVASVAGPAELERSPLGDFRIVQEIGRGGMGVVYEAEQISLGRRVALKILPFAAALDAKQLQRFKNEAQAAAQLQHTNIVPVHYVGCERGVHFYAMQYIDGQPLSQMIHELRGLTGCAAAGDSHAQGVCEHESPAAGRLARSAINARTGPRLAGTTLASTGDPAFFRTVAHLGVQAAEALEHAHGQGIIHRDIKPANLLVDGEGRLWIADFGLAHCQSQPGLSMTGDVLGTLRYMSPEQALAKRVLIDQRTDIYSLGITLYELLTLEPAFRSRDREELLREITSEEPRPPRRLNKQIPGELEIIVLKAVEKNPAERYASAQEVADDLRRFLEDKPIRAKHPTLQQKAVKWCRRHKSAMRSAAAVLILAVVGLAASTWLIWLEKEQTKTALTEAKANAERAQQNLDRAYRILDEIYVDTVEKRLPGGKELTAADRQFLANALAFYQEFAEQNSDDPQVRLQMAKAYRRVAGIHEQLGQAERAAAAYQQALTVSKKLDVDFPNDPDYRQNLARSYHALGGVSPFFNRSVTRSELEPALAEALRIQEQLVQEFPANLDYQDDLGATYHRLGYLHLFGYRLRAEAEGLVRKGVAIRQELVKARPSAFLYRRELLESLGNLGFLLTVTGRYDRAEEVVRQQMAAAQQMINYFPAEPFARMAYPSASSALANLREVTGRWPEAVAAHRQALRNGKQVVAAFPNMVAYLPVLARQSISLGDALRKIDAQDDALAAYAEAITTCQEAVRRQPKCAEAYVYWGIALARRDTGKQAVAVWEQGVQQGADMTAVVDSVYAFLFRSLDPQIQDPEPAVLLAQKAVALVPKSGLWWITLGAVSYRAGQWNEAVDTLKHALTLRSGDDRPLRSGDDSVAGFFLAMAHWHLSQGEKARRWYDQAVQGMDQNKPYDQELHRLRAEAATLLGIQEEPAHK